MDGISEQARVPRRDPRADGAQVDLSGQEDERELKGEIELARPVLCIARRIGRVADAGTMPAKIGTGLGTGGPPQRALRHDFPPELNLSSYSFRSVISARG